MSGGAGDDRMMLDGAATVAHGGEESDVFWINGGANTVDRTDSGMWVDTADFSGVFGRVVVDLGKGTALTIGFRGVVGHTTLTDVEAAFGSGGNDRLVGGAVANDSIETFKGGDGADTIRGGSGHDVLLSDREGPGAGVTVDLRGHYAIDTYGNRDLVRGIEEVYATEYTDTLSGNRADNVFHPDGGDDLVNGRGGWDSVTFFGTGFAGFAGVVVDLKAGTALGAGSMTLTRIEGVTGSAMGDRLMGKGNANILYGGQGDDRISGRHGDDVVAGGGGDDRLLGGLGADVFDFAPGGGRDRVLDFALGQDQLSLRGYGLVTAKQALAMAVQAHGNTVFTLDDGSQVILCDVLLADLTPLDFLF